MKSVFSECPLCDDAMRPGDPIENYWGRTFHRGCLDDFFRDHDKDDVAFALDHGELQ